MTAYELASTIVAALGMVGGAIGFFRSLVAGRAAAAAAARAADAQADATAALRRSAAADQRIAAALEAIAAHQGATPHGASTELPIAGLADELRALVPPAEVRWQVEPRTEVGTIRLRNVGTLDATAVAVDDDTTTGVQTVGPGGSIVLRGVPEQHVIVVNWHDDAQADEQSSRIMLPAAAPSDG